MDSINDLGWELGVEFEIPLTESGWVRILKKSFLHFDVKKKIYAKVTLNLTVNIEY